MTNGDVRQFVQKWYDGLSERVPVERLLPMTSNRELEMVFPERTLRNEAEFRDWYQGVGRTFADQQHIVERVDSRDEADGVHVDVTVIWRATQVSDDARLAFRATQSWLLGRSPKTGRPVIVKYRVLALTPLKEGALSPREAIARYYRYANAGDWNAWCDLFAEDVVIDEQLAGHVEGLRTLREMMAGMSGYVRFQNVPRHTIVDGDEGAVVSHISATTRSGASIEAGVMNYFRFNEDGRITYLANFHDTVPFKPFLEQSR